MARLEGMNQICDYAKRSDATVLAYIRQMDFPAAKLGSIWISDTDKIDDWFLDQIDNGHGRPQPEKAAEKPSKKKPPATTKTKKSKARKK